jgi:hypothetical protein
VAPRPQPGIDRRYQRHFAVDERCTSVFGPAAGPWLKCCTSGAIAMALTSPPAEKARPAPVKIHVDLRVIVHHMQKFFSFSSPSPKASNARRPWSLWQFYSPPPRPMPLCQCIIHCSLLMRSVECGRSQAHALTARSAASTVDSRGECGIGVQQSPQVNELSLHGKTREVVPPSLESRKSRTTVSNPTGCRPAPDVGFWDFDEPIVLDRVLHLERRLRREDIALGPAR